MEFDQYSSNYNEVLNQAISLSGEDWSYFSKYKADYISRRLSKDFKGRILDYGCGVGNILGFLKENYPQASLNGFDVSSASIEKIPNELKKNGLFTSNEEDLATDYDVIIAANVFHHVDHSDHLSFLAKLKNRLNNNGMLFIFEHNPLNPLTQWSVKHSPIDVNAHLVWPHNLRKNLSQVFSNSPELNYIVFFPRLMSRWRPYESMLSWLPMGAQYVLVAQNK